MLGSAEVARWPTHRMCVGRARAWLEVAHFALGQLDALFIWVCRWFVHGWPKVAHAHLGQQVAYAVWATLIGPRQAISCPCL